MKGMEEKTLFDQAADAAVASGNRLLERHPDGDAWEVAEGLLAGAIHYWLWAHQPCGDPRCEGCSEVATAELRLQKLLEEVKRAAQESSYYHSPRDLNVGNA